MKQVNPADVSLTCTQVVPSPNVECSTGHHKLFRPSLPYLSGQILGQNIPTYGEIRHFTLPVSKQTAYNLLHYVSFAVYNMSLNNMEITVHSLSDPQFPDYTL
jgi:hypothetical protein